MSTHTDIVVIGGGAAGMMAAIKALQEGCDVTVLEKNPFCGKKINIRERLSPFRFAGCHHNIKQVFRG